MRISKDHLRGNDKLLLTKRQVNRIAKCQISNKGCNINFSLTQLKQMAKHSGILPLLGLLPAILGGLGAVFGLAGGIASAVNNSKQTAEAQRQ